MMTEEEIKAKLDESIQKIKKSHPEYAVFLDSAKFHPDDDMYSTGYIPLTMKITLGFKNQINYIEEMKFLDSIILRMCWEMENACIQKGLDYLIRKPVLGVTSDAGDRIVLNPYIPDGVILMNQSSFPKYTKLRFEIPRPGYYK